MPVSYCDEASRDVSECRYLEEADREIEALKKAIAYARAELAYLHGYLEPLIEREKYGEVPVHTLLHLTRALNALREATPDDA